LMALARLQHRRQWLQGKSLVAYLPLSHAAHPLAFVVEVMDDGKPYPSGKIQLSKRL